jgi:GNAT superfamily N-acetyltransferase
MLPRLRQATTLDLPRISELRHGTAENRLEDPSLVTPAEVEWYLNEAIFLVSEDDAGIQGFACANHQTGYVWALFVIDRAQGRGHGTALLNEVIERFRRAGHRQAFLTTGKDTKAAAFYRSKGWTRLVKSRVKPRQMQAFPRIARVARRPRRNAVATNGFAQRRSLTLKYG